jgi:hypothetical protein
MSEALRTVSSAPCVMGVLAHFSQRDNALNSPSYILVDNSEGETRDAKMATSKVRFNLGVMRIDRLSSKVTGQNKQDKG